MPDFIFTPSSQPTLDAILANFNVVRLDQVRKNLIGGAAVLADELFTNVNPLVTYISLQWSLYNLEGAARTINFYNTAAQLLYTSNAIANVTSGFFNDRNILVFNYLTASGVMVNAATSMSFVGYRMITQ